MLYGKEPCLHATCMLHTLTFCPMLDCLEGQTVLFCKWMPHGVYLCRTGLRRMQPKAPVLQPTGVGSASTACGNSPLPRPMTV